MFAYPQRLSLLNQPFIPSSSTQMTLDSQKMYNTIRAATKDAALPASSPTSFNDIHEHQLFSAQVQQES